MNCSLHSRGFTLAETLVSLLLLSLIIVAFLGMLSTVSRKVSVQGGIADSNENLRYTLQTMIHNIRLAGSGGLPIVIHPSPSELLPLAIDFVDNAEAGRSFRSSISGKTWDITPNRPVIANTDILRIRGVISTPLYDVEKGNFSASTLKIPGISPWTSQPQRLIRMPSGRNRALFIALQDPLDLPFGSRGIRPYGLYRVVEVKNNPAVESGSLQIVYSDSPSEAYADLNPSERTRVKTDRAYAAGFLDDVVYYIARNNFNERSLYRIRVKKGTPGIAEELVPGLYSFQVALGCDINLNGFLDPNEWFFSRNHPDGPGAAFFSALREIRISVVAYSRDNNPRWSSRAVIPENGSPLSASERHGRYRILSVRTRLRSHPSPLIRTGAGS